MILINKKLPELSNKLRFTSPALVISEKGEFRFSASAVNVFNIEEGKFVHFLFMDKCLYCFFNDDSDGFLLQTGANNKSARRFTAIALMHYLKPIINTKMPVKFGLIDSEKDHNKNPLIEVMIKKSMNSIGKG